MKYYILIFILFTYFSSTTPSLTRACFKISETLNKFVGFVGHGCLNMVCPDANNRLERRNEDFVLETAEKLGFDGELNIYKLSKSKACDGGMVIGNYVYINEDFFEYLKDNPNVTRFVIAHELKHIEKLHFLKTVGCILLFFAFLNSSQVEEKMKKIGKDYIEPLIGQSIHKFPLTRNLTCLCIGAGIGSYILYPFMAFYLRFREKETDCDAFRAMTKLYGHTSVINAVKILFGGQNKEKPSLWSYLWRSHPLGKERVQYMEQLRDELLQSSDNEKCNNVLQ